MKKGANIRLRSDGRWEARYIKGRDENNNKTMGYCYGKTYEEAEQKRRDILGRLTETTGFVGSFSDVYALWRQSGDQTVPDGNERLISLIGSRSISSVNDTVLLSAFRKLKRTEDGESMLALYQTVEAVLNYAVEEGYLSDSPISEESSTGRYVQKLYLKNAPSKSGSTVYLSDKQFTALYTALRSSVNERTLGLLICLRMGLTLPEVCALKFEDIKYSDHILTVNKTLPKNISSSGRLIYIEERRLPIPDDVYASMTVAKPWYNLPSRYLVAGRSSKPKQMLLIDELEKINKNIAIAPRLTPDMLRDLFIKRSIACGADIVSLAAYIGEKSPAALMDIYTSLVKPDLISICQSRRPTSGVNSRKRMNLLILGAGGQGHVVKELAEEVGIFDKIDFLDDDPSKDALDVCSNYAKYVDAYPVAYPSFGNNALHLEWLKRLDEAGFILPRLIHPAATVARSAYIERGTVVEAKAIINSNVKVGFGCIISAGSTVDHNVVINDGCHIDCAATVSKNIVVPEGVKVKSGTVVTEETTFE